MRRETSICISVIEGDASCSTGGWRMIEQTSWPSRWRRGMDLLGGACAEAQVEWHARRAAWVGAHGGDAPGHARRVARGVLAVAAGDGRGLSRARVGHHHRLQRAPPGGQVNLQGMRGCGQLGHGQRSGLGHRSCKGGAGAGARRVKNAHLLRGRRRVRRHARAPGRVGEHLLRHHPKLAARAAGGEMGHERVPARCPRTGRGGIRQTPCQSPGERVRYTAPSKGIWESSSSSGGAHARQDGGGLLQRLGLVPGRHALIAQRDRRR